MFIVSFVVIGVMRLSPACSASVDSNQINGVHTMVQKDDDTGKLTSCSGNSSYNIIMHYS